MNSDTSFSFEFDGELIVKEGNWLKCDRKNVKVLINLLINAIKSQPPIGYKSVVGRQITGDEYCFYWRDEKFSHIGCLKVRNEEFKRKYIELIKHLNQNRDVNKS